MALLHDNGEEADEMERRLTATASDWEDADETRPTTLSFPHEDTDEMQPTTSPREMFLKQIFGMYRYDNHDSKEEHGHSEELDIRQHRSLFLSFLSHIKLLKHNT